MQAIRSYYNASGDLLRTDLCSLDVQPSFKGIVEFQPTGPQFVGRRNVKTTLAATTGASRLVDTITVESNCDTLEGSTGNFLFAQWNRGDGNTMTLDMSDLPVVGDSI